MVDQKIAEWVNLAIKNENLVNYHIEIEGKTGKGDGYLGNITFVKVVGKTKEDTEKTYNLVIKSSKTNNILREQMPIKECFEKEIYIYNRVKPEFDLFQKSKGVEDLLHYMPNSYASRETGTSELIILENLKPKGYSVWDRKIPMTFQHLELILQAYGKWHAFSLALKKENPTRFDLLTENNINIQSKIITKVGMIEMLFEIVEAARDETISAKENNISKKVMFSKNDVKHALVDLFFEDPEDQVILHGDCWTNNFLFVSEKSSNKPVDVKIIDWQCSGVGSPAIDLSHVIYSCCDTGTYKDVEILLKMYHKSLKNSLEKLGFQAEKIFPYNKLLRHWSKYSRFGVILSSFILKFSLCDAADAPDFDEVAQEGKEFIKNLHFDLKNPEEYFKRVQNNFHHYKANLFF